MSEKPVREWRVWVAASGYATVLATTKKEAGEKAREGIFVNTPRPDWHAQVSDIREVPR